MGRLTGILILLLAVLAVFLHASHASTVPNEASISGLIKRAQDGDAQSQYELFAAYRSGTGVERNVEQAKLWLFRASENGHPEAQFWAGYVLFFAQGFPRDVDSGVHWFTLSAEQGNMHAQKMLGQIYNGWRYRFHKSDPAKAEYWYTRAAEQGDVQSIFIIGCKHYLGRGQLINTPLGLSWFRKAAELGDDTVMKYLEMNDYEDLSLFCERIARL